MFKQRGIKSTLTAIRGSASCVDFCSTIYAARLKKTIRDKAFQQETAALEMAMLENVRHDNSNKLTNNDLTSVDKSMTQ